MNLSPENGYFLQFLIVVKEFYLSSHTFLLLMLLIRANNSWKRLLIINAHIFCTFVWGPLEVDMIVKASKILFILLNLRVKRNKQNATCAGLVLYQRIIRHESDTFRCFQSKFLKFNWALTNF